MWGHCRLVANFIVFSITGFSIFQTAVSQTIEHFFCPTSTFTFAVCDRSEIVGRLSDWTIRLACGKTPACFSNKSSKSWRKREPFGMLMTTYIWIRMKSKWGCWKICKWSITRNLIWNLWYLRRSGQLVSFSGMPRNGHGTHGISDLQSDRLRTGVFLLISSIEWVMLEL